MKTDDAANNTINLGTKLFALSMVFVLLLLQGGSPKRPSSAMASEVQEVKSRKVSVGIRYKLPNAYVEDAAVFIVSDDTANLANVLKGVISQDERGVVYTADPVPTLTLRGVAASYRQWTAYSLRGEDGPILTLVKIYYLWTDGSIKSGWFVSGATFPDGSAVSFVQNDPGYIDPYGSWPATLVTLQLSGAHVTQTGVNWGQDCPFDRQICNLGEFAEAGYGLTTEFLESGHVPGHPMYGYLFGWTITAEKIIRVSDYDIEQPIIAAGGLR